MKKEGLKLCMGLPLDRGTLRTARIVISKYSYYETQRGN